MYKVGDKLRCMVDSREPLFYRDVVYKVLEARKKCVILDNNRDNLMHGWDFYAYPNDFELAEEVKIPDHDILYKKYEKLKKELAETEKLMYTENGVCKTCGKER